MTLVEKPASVCVINILLVFDEARERREIQPVSLRTVKSQIAGGQSSETDGYLGLLFLFCGELPGHLTREYSAHLSSQYSLHVPDVAHC